MPRFRKIASYRSDAALLEHSAALGIPLPAGARSSDSAVLAQEWHFDDAAAGRFRIGNRFTILPMEGWDGTEDGGPGATVRRRWLRFAVSGAKLLWCEASAVRHDGRANPRQLVLSADRVAAFRELRREAVACHIDKFGSDRDFVTGIQLTHSGRWCRPRGEAAPRIVYRHPFLDRRAGIDDDTDIDAVLMSDGDIGRLIEDFVAAGIRARDAGFDFVDIKHCHGYFAHELLSAYRRPGPYGGSLQHRTRFLREVVGALRERCPELAIAVRFSAFDFQPFRPGADDIGEPETAGDYPYAFGADASGLAIDWQEIEAFVAIIAALGIGLICVTAGSPYYTPHIQRPAFYPPSDGYQPPEDPLLGVARMLDAARRIKQRFPQLGVVGTGFTYLQQHLPAVAAGCIEHGWMDSVGLGRMSLSYPDLPDDVLNGRPLARKQICRTFSDCTTAPRNGMVSGCYPLDEFYRSSEEYERLQRIKRMS
jgi:2,4-dienoyl-CoA reductase-like NADH-dependent reductase (Old Yellow Enzyme family)